MTVINHASSPIRYIYVESQGYSAKWSDDLLGFGNFIPQNYQKPILMSDGSGNCTLYINVVLNDRREVTYPKINVCEGQSLSVADDDVTNRYLKVVNHTSIKIRYVYVATPNGSWGEDLLGSFVTIDPDESLRVNIYKANVNCDISMKVVFYDKTEWTYSNVHPCAEGTLYVSPAK